MRFEPIAIVGRGCVLPGALEPDVLWRNVESGVSSLSTVAMERWRLPGQGYNESVSDPRDRVSSRIGGFVEGFADRFSPDGYAIDAEQILALDPLFHWVLYGARAALREAGQDGPLPEAGLVLGNLGYPSESASRFAEQVWLGAKAGRPHPRNWFSAGLPALLAARALELGAGGFAFDAACASGLYAVKLACDRLQDRKARFMIAGAVNRADALFIHQGFSALSAVSPSGRSRPFCRDADGMVPAEGGGFVALMRLADALAEDVPVLGVIRGVGLSSDGRGSGLLVPDRRGQEAAMRLAYEQASVDPATVSLIECHGVGTSVGDEVEARALAKVFADSPDLPIRSVKANIGHALPAAGMAGLLAALGAIRAGVRPGLPDPAEPADVLTGTPLRLLTEAEDWPGRRRAAISAFGFGGVNAHLVLDSWEAGAVEPGPMPKPNEPDEPIAIVAIGARVGQGDGVSDLRRSLLTGEPRLEPPSTVDVDLEGLCFPPMDLRTAQARQLLVLAAAREAVIGLALPSDRTAVFIGTGSDTLAARYGARWRTSSLLAEADPAVLADPTALADPTVLAATREAFAPPLVAPAVVGTMPNLVAQRVSAQLDLHGPGFAVFAEEASGLAALDLAARALRTREMDAVLVGAVEFADDPVQLAALESDTRPGTAAVVLVLKRLSDARRDGDSVIALLDDAATEAPDLVIGPERDRDSVTPGFDPADLFGAPHAATGLLSLAVGALALAHRALPRAGSPALPSTARTVEVRCPVREATPVRARLRADAARPWVGAATPRVRVYSGRDRAEVIAALETERESVVGPARLALVVADAELADRRVRARRWLLGEEIQPRGVAYRDAPLEGRTAFVFTNGSAAYPEMGRQLALAFPELLDRIESGSGLDRSLLNETGGDALDQIMATGVLIGLHTGISRSLLGDPDAVIGYSSGESAAMAALEMWTDPSHAARCRASGLFDREIGGEYRAIRQVWARNDIQGIRWDSYLVSLDAERARAALADEPAVHLIAVNAPGLCVVGGEAEACASWIARQSAQAVPIAYDIAAHAPELGEFRELWWKLHHLPTTPIPGVRVYSCASGESYQPTAERVADALTSQMLGTIDYVRVIERAWADGVRAFVEHGPRNLCTSWIGRILDGREHLAVALDGPEHGGVDQLNQVIAELTAAGVAIDPGGVLDHLTDASSVPARERLSIPIATTEVRVTVPAERRPTEVMARAPYLPAAPMWTLTAPVASAPATAPATAVASASASAVAIAEHRDRITAVHRSVLAARTEAHRSFATTRNEAQRRYLDTVTTVFTSMPQVTPRYRFVRPETPAYPGPSFDREQLEFLAHEKISTLFGPAFAGQDHRRRQTRLPRPPMLLVDRVLGIDAEPAALATGSSATTGTIWTETDVPLGAWYLDATGRMPAGIMVEAGQADLLLISWLGADLLDDQDRVYRLLGCELTLHGSPALPGDTLRYEIHIDGHAEHNGVRLFFFHYDCYVGDELRMSVRQGQAGYFTDAELNESQGVLWDPGAVVPDPVLTVDPPPLVASSQFTAEQVRAFTEGRPADCFGQDWELTRAHIRSPRAGSDRFRMLREVPTFDPTGGPWGRGYLRAETPVAADDWFFDGHFHNDPCMPGTLMLEGALQAMAFYLAACGHTIDRDGWRFEPAPGAAAALRCRRQVTPADSRLVYEVFVTGLRGGVEPALTADVVCTVDGVQAFHAQGLELRLVADWPLEHWRQLGPAQVQRDGTPVSPSALGGLRGYRDESECVTQEGVRCDYPMLLAMAWGRQPEAVSPWAVGPGESRRIPRLPGPPYHFMTRVVEENIARGAERVGDRIVAEYDVPDSAWYFEQNGHPTMPLAVLMEVALQPCGCLANQVTDLAGSQESLYFRNLDGKGEIVGEVTPATRVVCTEVTLRGVARHGGMIIETFDVECRADGAPLLTFSTVFGYFPRTALRDQVGLPPAAEEERALAAPSDQALELADYTKPTRSGLPGPMLLMLDRVTGFWPDGGKVGLGRLRAEKDIDAGDWYFKAHFFQDPVQPGSLGVEAVCQLLQLYLLASGRTAGLKEPRFEPVALGEELSWKYRGQILPTDGTMTVELEITGVKSDNRGCHATGEAWVWVDGRRIYHVPAIGVRAVARDTAVSPASVESVLDPVEEDWLLDHRVIWLVSRMPLMSMVDRLADAAVEHTGLPVAGLSDVQLSKWLPTDQPVRLRTEVDPAGDGVNVTLLAWREASTEAMSRFERTASGVVRLGAPRRARPAPFPPLADVVEVPDPYTSGEMFHGSAFQYVTSLRMSALGSTSVLDVGRGRVPRGRLHQGLLDGALHGVPVQRLGRWVPGVAADAYAVPHRVPILDWYEPLPDSGLVVVEARFAGFEDDNPLLPSVDFQLQVEGRVAVGMCVVFALVRSPWLGALSLHERRAYLRDRQYVEGAGLSATVDRVTELRIDVVSMTDALPEAVACHYGLPHAIRGSERAPMIAAKEHLSRLFQVHPFFVELADDLRSAWVTDRPETIRGIQVRQRDGLVTVTTTDGSL